MKTAIIIIMLLLFPCLSFAYTGNNLLYDCEMLMTPIKDITLTPRDDLTSEQYLAAGRCSGYVQAMLDENEGTKEHPVVCIPDKITIEQTVRIIIKFLKDHPQQMNLSADVLVNAAFVHAFPCRGK